MDMPIHSMQALFEQLGLDGSEDGIEKFIEKNAPLAKEVPLHKAPFWNDSQAAFLREEIREDADWADVVDQLNVRLRG